MRYSWSLRRLLFFGLIFGQRLGCVEGELGVRLGELPEAAGTPGAA